MNKRNTAHAIMFHHFHDQEKHIVGQGSVSAEELDELISHYKQKHRLISSEEWYEKALNDRLSRDDVCLTFDDGLKCQFDIALPVLETHKLTAFWFVYTSHFSGEIEKLELYRYFRFKAFTDIVDFYQAFYASMEAFPWASRAFERLEHFDPNTYLNGFSFYTTEDRKFRYIRDQILGKEKYDQIMSYMIDQSQVNTKNLKQLLWVNEADLLYLDKKGHKIGLHSHTHPTFMESLPFEQQRQEYHLNNQFLSTLLQQEIDTMSHPCNSYSQNTLKILRNMGIKLGFRANMELKNPSKMEYPRIDHTYILKEAKDENKRIYQ